MADTKPYTEILVSDDPADLVLALVEAAKLICQKVGKKPHEGIMLLLIAAASIAAVGTGKPAKANADELADALGTAITLADSLFETGNFLGRKSRRRAHAHRSRRVQQ